MALLHNRISGEELKQRMLQETETRITIGFYRYFEVENPLAFRNFLYQQLDALSVFGRIYIAKEGINAQVNVPEKNVTVFKEFLASVDGLQNLRLNIAVDDGKSFWVLKIKVRDKIVADGIADETFSMNHKGRYVNATQMNASLQQPDTIVIDMRNHYEYEVGHFANALAVPSDTFREQLPMVVDMLRGKEDSPIIMYCTGGIRCEKASAYLLHHGFRNVSHLEGGIINYAKEITEQHLESKFTGKNFVFDNRLGERITEDVIAHCHQCGKPCDAHTNCKNDGCHLLFIQCEDCGAKYESCCSTACKETLHMPLERQADLRKGIDNGRLVFNKSKERLRPRLGE